MAGSNDSFNVGKIYIIGFIVKFNDVIGLYVEFNDDIIYVGYFVGLCVRCFVLQIFVYGYHKGVKKFFSGCDVCLSAFSWHWFWTEKTFFSLPWKQSPKTKSEKIYLENNIF